MGGRGGLAADELADDSGPRGDTHLQHDQAQEDLNGVGTNLHAGGNFLAGQPTQQQSGGLNLPVRQAVLIAEVRQFQQHVMPTLDEQSVGGLKRVLDMSIEAKSPQQVTPFAGGEFHQRGAPQGREVAAQ